MPKILLILFAVFFVSKYYGQKSFTKSLILLHGSHYKNKNVKVSIPKSNIYNLYFKQNYKLAITGFLNNGKTNTNKEYYTIADNDIDSIKFKHNNDSILIIKKDHIPVIELFKRNEIIIYAQNLNIIKGNYFLQDFVFQFSNGDLKKRNFSLRDNGINEMQRFLKRNNVIISDEELKLGLRKYVKNVK